MQKNNGLEGCQVSLLVDLLLKSYHRRGAVVLRVILVGLLPEAVNIRVGERCQLVWGKAVSVPLNQEKHIPYPAPRIGHEFGLDQPREGICIVNQEKWERITGQRCRVFTGQSDLQANAGIARGKIGEERRGMVLFSHGGILGSSVNNSKLFGSRQKR